MNDLGEFSGNLLPEKEHFYSHLNMKDITEGDCVYVKKDFKDFKIRNLGDYHYLQFQSNTLLLAGVFEQFRNVCLAIYEPDSAHFLSTPGLAWQ